MLNFEDLYKIKENSPITREDILKLDDWLARTPYRDRNNLSFVKFAEQAYVDKFTAFMLFIESRNIGVLDLKFKINEDNESKLFDEVTDIPENTYDDEVELVFNLISKQSKTIAESIKDK